MASLTGFSIKGAGFFRQFSKIMNSDKFSFCSLCNGFFVGADNSTRLCFNCSPSTRVSRTRRHRTDRAKTPPIMVRLLGVKTDRGMQTEPSYQDRALEFEKQKAEALEDRVSELKIQMARLEKELDNVVGANDEIMVKLAHAEEDLEILMTPVNSENWNSGRLGAVFQQRSQCMGPWRGID